MTAPNTIVDVIDFINPTYMDYCPTNNSIYFTGYDPQINIIDTTTNKLNSIKLDPSSYYERIVYCPINNSMYITENYKYIKVFNINTNTITDNIEDVEDLYCSALCYCPTNNYIYAALHFGKVKVINTFTNKVIDTIEIADATYTSDICFCPTNNSMYVCCIKLINGDPYGFIAVINTSTNTVTDIIESDLSYLNQICYCPTNNSMYITASKLGDYFRVIAINTITKTITNITKSDKTLSRPYFCPTNNFIYVIHHYYYENFSKITIIDTATNTVIDDISLTPYYYFIIDICFSPSNNCLYLTNPYRIIVLSTVGNVNHSIFFKYFKKPMIIKSLNIQCNNPNNPYTATWMINGMPIDGWNNVKIEKAPLLDLDVPVQYILKPEDKLSVSLTSPNAGNKYCIRIKGWTLRDDYMSMTLSDIKKQSMVSFQPWDLSDQFDIIEEVSL